MKYRNFAVATWSDDIVLSMSPEQKLIFIYLYTSPYTSPCGIFKLSMRTAGFQLGYTNSPFESALKGLCAAFPSFVAYDDITGEVALLQYPKQLLICATGKALIISQKEVEKVESQKLLRAMIEQNSAGLSRVYLTQLRRLQMQKINDSANVLLCGDMPQVAENQEDDRKIEIESKVYSILKDTIVVFDENDDTPRVPEIAPTKRIKKTDTPPAAAAIIARLNAATGSAFRPGTKSTIAAINARLAEGYTEEDFHAVIDFKAAQWRNDEKMSGFLRPETLFRPAHFESYLNEAKRAPQANTDAALKDLTLPQDIAGTYDKFIEYVQVNFPALWRSGCRILSRAEYLDYTLNTSCPAVAVQLTPTDKRAALMAVLRELSGKEYVRRKYDTVFKAYQTYIVQILNRKTPQL
jgi:uncharacterized phage protein (TIGR02220 family)